jgi:hypothetical protein
MTKLYKSDEGMEGSVGARTMWRIKYPMVM